MPDPDPDGDGDETRPAGERPDRERTGQGPEGEDGRREIEGSTSG